MVFVVHLTCPMLKLISLAPLAPWYRSGRWSGMHRPLNGVVWYAASIVRHCLVLWYAASSICIPSWAPTLTLRPSLGKPSFSAALISSLNSWYKDPATIQLPSPHWDHITTKLIAAQNNIGWQLCLEGCVHKSWEETIDKYLQSLDSKKTGKRWITSLIKKLWDVAWDMWEHRNAALWEEKKNMQLLGQDITQAKITEEHETGIDALMTKDEKALFCQPLTAILELPMQRQESWLDKAQAARALCNTRNSLVMRQVRQLMHNYLQHN